MKVDLAPSLLDFVQHLYPIVKFEGGKFRDSSVDHENNENWHPTKITRYTVAYMYVNTEECMHSGLVKAL